MATVKKSYPAQSADVKHFISGEKKKNDHYLHAVIHFDSFIDVPVLIRSVEATLPAVPLLSCRYVEEGDRAYWEQAEWSAHDMVELIETGEPESRLHERLVLKLDERRGPQLHIAVIRDKEKKRDALAIVLNHMICDGGGFKDYLYLLSTCYTQLAERGRVNGPLIAHPDGRSIRQVFTAMTTQQLEQVKQAPLRHYHQSARDYLPLKGDARHPFILTHTASAERFDRIKAYVKSREATINDALFAAYVCALGDAISADPIVLDCPVNLRTYLSPDAAPGLCNLTSNITCVVPAEAGRSFDRALSAVKKVMDREKASFEPLRVYWDLEEVYQTHPLSEAKRLFPSIYNIPVNGMTNIGIISADALKFAGLEIRDTFISGSIKFAPYFQIAVTTFKKKMTFCTNFHGTEEDRAFLNRFVEQLIGYLPD